MAISSHARHGSVIVDLPGDRESARRRRVLQRPPLIGVSRAVPVWIGCRADVARPGRVGLERRRDPVSRLAVDEAGIVVEGA